MGHGPPEEPFVAVVQDAEEPGVLGGVAAFLGHRQPAAGHHGSQGEGHEQGHQDGEGHGEAEGVHEAADDAAHEGDGEEHRHEGEGGRQHRQADLPRALDGRLEGGEFLLLHEPVDVLQDHDGVVDDDADRQRQGEQGQDVQGESHGVHEGERAHDGRRDGDGGDQGGAPVAKEQQDDEGRQDRAHDQVLLDGLDRILDEVRLIPDDLKLVAGRQARAQTIEPLRDLVHDGHGVRPGLSLDGQDHRRLAVHVAGRLGLLGAVLGPAHLRQGDLRPAARGDHDPVEIRDAVHPALHPDGQLAGALAQVSPGKLQVLVGHRADDLGGGQGIGAEAGRVEPEVDLTEAAADERHLAHARDRLDFAPEGLVRELADVADGAIGRDGRVQDRGRVRVDLVHHRLVDVLREIGEDLVDLVTYLLGRHVDALLQLELDEDLGHALRGYRAELVNPRDGVYGPLDLVGDLGLDLLRRGACLPCRHRDDREVHLRETGPRPAGSRRRPRRRPGTGPGPRRRRDA